MKNSINQIKNSLKASPADYITWKTVSSNENKIYSLENKVDHGEKILRDQEQNLQETRGTLKRSNSIFIGRYR